MHVGEATDMPGWMVRSFRKHNPDFRIVQLTDQRTRSIEGVDQVIRYNAVDSNLMLFRMRCFADFDVSGPSWFVDTDMLCARPLQPPSDNLEVAVCKREFYTQSILDHRFNGLDMQEYRGRKLGDVYPYVGCVTYLNGSDFWSRCLTDMEALDAKFHNWYGDQEAIRNVVNSGRYAAGHLRESLYACLPEGEPYAPAPPFIFHYKGTRKNLMSAKAEADGFTR